MQSIFINPARSRGTISKNIFGHFSEHLGRCIYQGLFVGKDSPIPNVNGMRADVVQALKKIGVPVLRWPGGCFADEYHWEDGIGPQEGRKRMVNTHWGGVVEDNSFGTHEFLELCDQLGCEPYINANVGSGTIREMAEWVEYLNSAGDSTVVKKRWANGRKDPWGVKFWGVGNESWGCGGNMRPEYYADEFRRYQTYCRNYGDHKLYRIACGPNTDDYNWTEVLMKNAGRFMDALTLHYYTLCGDTWDHKGSATGFTVSDYYKTLVRAARMEELVTRHSQIMDRYDPEKRVGLIVDEWGAWYDVEPGTNPGFLYQQNTMRDAMIAAITLNVFMAHCDRVVMANLAQTVNVLQSVILTEGDKMVLTPTYHVFDLYRAHQDATLIESHALHDLTGPAESPVPLMDVSASVDAQGVVHVTAVNLSADEAVSTRVLVPGMDSARVRVRTLSGDIHAHNTFDAPEQVKPAQAEETALRQGECTVTLPPCSVTELTITQERQ